VKNVANVVSAGKIDNILNSVKGIVGTIFNKSALENKYPVKKWIMDKKEKYFEKFVPNVENIKKISKELSKGNDYLEGINNFADITKKENEAFLTELIKTAEITSDAIDLSICEGVKGLQFYQDDVVRLQSLNTNIEEVNLLHESYIKLVEDLKDHYQQLEIGLTKRKNLFDEVKNKMSYDKYDEYRKESLESIQKINSLLDRIFPEEESK